MREPRWEGDRVALAQDVVLIGDPQVSGVGSTTLPLFVFGEVRRGVTPKINAVAAVMLVLTLTILFVTHWLLGRRTQGRGVLAMTPVVDARAQPDAGR